MGSGTVSALPRDTTETGGPLRSRALQGLRAGAVPGSVDDFVVADPASALESWFGKEAWLALARQGRAAVVAALSRDIAAIDEILRVQLDAILHHPRFQRLEAGWRGLFYLVGQVGDTDGILVKVLNVGWGELARDFERSIEFDQSALFSMVYSNEFGMPGGQPYGVLLCDYEVRFKRTKGHSTDDIGVVTGLSQVAAAAFAPAVLGCSPELIGLEDFSELGRSQSLQDVSKDPGYRRWQRIRETEDSRFVGIVLPRVLMRPPHAAAANTGFCYWEDVSAPDRRDLLWGNAVYAFGAVLIRSFRTHGWFADIRGTSGSEPSGGVVTDLTASAFATDHSATAPKPAAEVIVSEVLERQLADMGLISLSYCRLTSDLAFFSAVSIKQPEGNLSAPAAMANARLSCMLHYMLCVSRFSHYIKVIARDSIGSYSTPEDLERMLADWLRGYQLANDDASPEMKAQFPLRDGSVRVQPHASRQGVYRCVIHLQPHFQLDQVISTFRLTTELATTDAMR